MRLLDLLSYVNKMKLSPLKPSRQWHNSILVKILLQEDWLWLKDNIRALLLATTNILSLFWKQGNGKTFDFCSSNIIKLLY
jgi:hypothetical protein